MKELTEQSYTRADHQFMARALQLAAKGLYTTDPNPRVGCVIVRYDQHAEGQVVGEGFHLRAGEPHAEIHALNAAGVKAEGATAYVTLEPCSHTGRTGPCAVALAEANVARVVVAMVDPNPCVSGRGIKRLRESGIQVDVGLLEQDARVLNPGFISRMQHKRPFVRLKMAMSLDGRTAMGSGESQWITGPEARSQVQRLRARSSAILSGVESVIMDDSRLTVRADQLGLDNADTISQRQPLRVILDSRLRLPLAAACLREPGRTLIITTEHHSEEKRQKLKAAGADIKVLPAAQEGRIDLTDMLNWLAEHELVNELLVETGATLAGALLDANVVDELQLFVAPTLLGGEARPLFALPGMTRMADQKRLTIKEIRAVGNDWRIIAKPCTD
ncbi:bifunctional diaminohydroxyphosphoribosylaminopyrimidine deaminase/5-amino-6-(5-phosphoribosylamino)uracil reductase RibD [Vreelandella venusta]|uniref:bifunctional diaminohydroxyphosphoribosylaminopyrimidine deaminase/5-amino-6-(5-phosphoribosylamino)uracil reductase RibD n=1 Tax=Vreelandella venusta TaxID=44935 RepID=UPI00200FA3AD|nr:bifunctional diaminohydroxyphosphoribosylaminopyrimidine deaminase/5-amino-6-(5-phosphoribosylamino)uracil reductase RibD [Halomonas venusta]MDX1356836.1 bifunctional diaminohydroxyphosphoribosylaminopyrimidine deaminase/5-amino-6-(5-phosphoribosylamino)uracil reductase RibD [Halomonas venusta]UQI39417.1 bifunctional diaminohydroxyphosphoribosylaminopyrimidine deaminase/5-amino-6-(5-phosphoribosylamino)uracil reductase RibD [Halomonas venusta]WAM50974.1 bifunctional diaminohydroxyphosphoribos